MKNISTLLIFIILTFASFGQKSENGEGKEKEKAARVQIPIETGRFDVDKREITLINELLFQHYTFCKKGDTYKWKEIVSPNSFCYNEFNKMSNKVHYAMTSAPVSAFAGGEKINVVSVVRNTRVVQGSEIEYYICLVKMPDNILNEAPSSVDAMKQLVIEKPEQYTALNIVREKDTYKLLLLPNRMK